MGAASKSNDQIGLANILSPPDGWQQRHVSSTQEARQKCYDDINYDNCDDRPKHDVDNLGDDRACAAEELRGPWHDESDDCNNSGNDDNPD